MMSDVTEEGLLKVGGLKEMEDGDKVGKLMFFKIGREML